MDKYSLLTEMAKALDERDHLREENDILERELREFKVSAGSGELTPAVRKMYELGREALFEKCFRTWHSIGVNDSGGEPYPASSFAEWREDSFHSSYLPDNYSKDEVFDACGPILMAEYDKKWEEEKAAWLKENSEEDA